MSGLGETDEVQSRWRALAARPAVVFLAASVLVAAGAIWTASQTYFRFDEWAYWTFRRDLLDAGGWKDLFHFFFSPRGGSPFGGAMPTGVMATWLPIDAVFGMRIYLPYAIPTLAAHITAAWLVFRLVRDRASTVVALAAAVLLLVLGNAASAITYGWLVNFAVPIACGLGVLVVVDHPFRREWLRVGLTLALSLGALAFGAIGVPVALIAATAYALRRSWLAAVAHPLAVTAVFMAWRSYYDVPTVAATVGDVWRYAAFFAKGLATAAGELMGLPMLLGFGVLAVIGTGAVLLWRDQSARRLTIPLLVGATSFYGTVAIRSIYLPERSFSFDQERYLYVAAAFLVPVLAIVVDRLLSRRPLTRTAATIAVVVFAWALGANTLHAIDAYGTVIELGEANRATIETAASLVDRLDELEAGFLVADRTARFTGDQFARLVEGGTVPCVEDLERAVVFARRQGLEPPPTADDVSCRGA